MSWTPRGRCPSIHIKGPVLTALARLPADPRRSERRALIPGLRKTRALPRSQQETHHLKPFLCSLPGAAIDFRKLSEVRGWGGGRTGACPLTSVMLLSSCLGFDVPFHLFGSKENDFLQKKETPLLCAKYPVSQQCSSLPAQIPTHHINRERFDTGLFAAGFSLINVSHKAERCLHLDNKEHLL